VSSAAVMNRLALIVALLLLAVPATALASADDVIQDCADDFQLSRTYSQAEYKQALQDLPADLDEYSPCRDVIRQAQLQHAGSSKSSGSGQSTGARKTSERNRKRIQKQLKKARTPGARPGALGNMFVKPATVDSSASIPAPLIVLLLLTALGAVGAGAIAIRRIVISRRNR
jgi:hypothetical protein